ncbi:putative ATP3-F1F0-ATPase complex, F1 gamma subunit [Tilletiopsis washingtonensis]|uniref:ATP synthase subunit gamma n=1 Tax=Tilletiopsis washingtonensis TaxID=58919 RepID=A0A316ZH48_9BASI|nr:putative ATP3-F1F0-ATPase complex, F1 gamma subunit [Tilletiopsis washingtonensis]PWO00587.1 putative ATP3-F1F0-ATPase complex, F1 gamma subunit [Tilletiopsis washingtonensis]
MRALAAAPAAPRAFHASATQCATLRELEGRVKSVKNIEKITKSMMMIASTKLAKAQRAMNAAKVYGEANNEIFKNSEAVSPSGGKELFIVVSSDKGLCGGIHSSVARRVRSEMAKLGGEAAVSTETTEGPKIVVLGEKTKAQLARALPKNVSLSFNQIGKDVPTFADASAIADQIVSSGLSFDKVNIVYNAYVSAIAFESRIMEVFSEGALRDAPNFGAYELEEDTVKDLAEFSLANAIYAALVEGHAAEINSKRNAMDNASKNAGDMISNLQMQYNRGRQATITNELVDIITGASAL